MAGTIICKDCGNQNVDDDAFCGSCGAFLEFSGQRVSETAAVATAHDEAGSAGRVGIIDRIKVVAGVDDDTVARNDEDLAGKLEGERAEAERVGAEIRAKAEVERLAKQHKEAEGAARLAAEQALRDRKDAEEAARKAEADAEAAIAAARGAQQTAEREAAAARQRAEIEAARRAAELQQQAQERVEAERRVAEEEAHARAERARREAELAARQAEEQSAAAAAAEQKRLLAQQEVARRAADAAAAVLRAQQEHDAIKGAEAARAASEAEVAQARAEADEARAEAEALAAQARAEAQQARAESARLRAEAQERSSQDDIARAEVDARHRADAEAAAARARAEAERDTAAHRAEAEAEIAALRAKAQADAAAAKAEAEVAAANAAAVAARIREEQERARQEHEADSAKRAREEAMRKAAALVAKPPATVPAGSKPGKAGPAPAKKRSEEPAVAAEVTVAASSTASQPVAQRPTETRARSAPKRVGPTRDVNPGDLICGECGEGNGQTRKFCRRCGTSLAQAVVHKVGWFRRLSAKLFGARKRRKLARMRAKAGERPGGGGFGKGVGGKGTGLKTRFRLGMAKLRRYAFRIFVLAGALAALGMNVGPFQNRFFFPNARQIINRNIKGFLNQQFDPVRPSGATASSSIGENTADKAIDQVSNSFWAEGGPGEGIGQSLVLTFKKPVSVDRIGFLIGASAKAEDFIAQPRPRELKITFNDATEGKVVTLKDKAEFQTVNVKGREVIRITMEIVSAHISPKGKDTSITEIEVFEKRKFGTQYETLDSPTVSASASGPGGAPTLLVDGEPTTAWVSGDLTADARPVLTFTFREPVELDRLRFANGLSDDKEKFQSLPRAKELQISFPESGETKTVKLSDKAGFQSVNVKVKGITRIEVVVVSAHGVQIGGPQGAAIAEVQFQKKRESS